MTAVPNVYTSPILMSGTMVSALLDGRKTQTRRIPTGQWRNVRRHFEWDQRCLLWVRETWGSIDADHPKCEDGQRPQNGDRLVYRANPADDYQWGAGKSSQGSFSWRPSIHLPRWASRLTLEVTNVWLDRLNEINEADAIAEGIEPVLDQGVPVGWKSYDKHEQGYYLEAVNSYDSLWESLHGEGSWGSNPDVMVIEFRVHQQNVDALVSQGGAA